MAGWLAMHSSCCYSTYTCRKTQRDRTECCSIGLSVSFLHRTLWDINVKEKSASTQQAVHHVTAKSRLGEVARPLRALHRDGGSICLRATNAPLSQGREMPSRMHLLGDGAWLWCSRGRERKLARNTMDGPTIIPRRNPPWEHCFKNHITTCPAFHSCSDHILFACMRHTRHEWNNRLALFYFLLVISLTEL